MSFLQDFLQSHYGVSPSQQHQVVDLSQSNSKPKKKKKPKVGSGIGKTRIINQDSTITLDQANEEAADVRELEEKDPEEKVAEIYQQNLKRFVHKLEAGNEITMSLMTENGPNPEDLLTLLENAGESISPSPDTSTSTETNNNNNNNSNDKIIDKDAKAGVKHRDQPEKMDNNAKEAAKESQSREGLQSLAEFTKDLEEKKKKKKLVEGDLEGQHSETIYRDRFGKRIDVTTERALLAERKRKYYEFLQKEMEWGKGRVQREAAAAASGEEEGGGGGNIRLAQYADDEDLNQELREKVRWDDPLKKKQKQKKKQKKKKKKGEEEWEELRYEGPCPANRFDILPGYRWDGVDRSNGFEKRIMEKQSLKISRAAEDHKWSVEDM